MVRELREYTIPPVGARRAIEATFPLSLPSLFIFEKLKREDTYIENLEGVSGALYSHRAYLDYTLGKTLIALR